MFKKGNCMGLSRRVCLAFVVCLPVLLRAQQSPAPGAVAEQSQAASQSAPQAPAVSAATPTTAVSPRSAPNNGEGRIHLDVVVTDKAGNPVSGLSLQDFTLLDNNRPNKILSFRPSGGSAQKADPPVEVIVLLDTVNLGFDQVAVEREQIERFLRRNGGHLAQPVSFFVLTDEGLNVQRHPALDGNGLAAEVSQVDNQLRDINREGGVWGAIERYQFSVQTMMVIAGDEAKKPGRKLLIWTGPGWPLLDNLRLRSTYKDEQQDFRGLVQLSTGLREARVSVYSVSLGQPNLDTFLYRNFLQGVKTAAQVSPPRVGLKVLAVQSGGLVLGPDNDMTAQIDHCVQDASAFYTLSFDAPHAAHANEYHDLKVLVDKPGLTARTNTGYYNQP
jgi:VWFA-related protein